MYEFAGKEAPFLILSSLALLDGGKHGPVNETDNHIYNRVSLLKTKKIYVIVHMYTKPLNVSRQAGSLFHDFFIYETSKNSELRQNLIHKKSNIC